MLIRDHRVFPSQIRGIGAPSGAIFGNCRLLGEYPENADLAGSAQKRRFIKPNKTEEPKFKNFQTIIGNTNDSPRGVSMGNRRQHCTEETTKRTSK